MKTLIVEDIRSVRNLLNRMVNQAGVEEVLTACNGAEALEMIKENKFDLLFLDIRLPDMSGLDVLSKIRSLYPDLYVVIATGYEEVDTVQEIIRLGANQYIVKPIEFEKVENIVEQCKQKLTN